MKEGEIYKIFEDPVTKMKLEGCATIVRIEKIDTDSGCKYCVVRFEGEDLDAFRMVYESDKIRR